MVSIHIGLPPTGVISSFLKMQICSLCHYSYSSCDVTTGKTDDHLIPEEVKLGNISFKMSSLKKVKLNKTSLSAACLWVANEARTLCFSFIRKQVWLSSEYSLVILSKNGRSIRTEVFLSFCDWKCHNENMVIPIERRQKCYKRRKCSRKLCACSKLQFILPSRVKSGIIKLKCSKKKIAF